MELTIFEFVQAHLHNPTLNRVVQVITHVGGIPIWMVIACALFFFKQYRRNAIALVAAVGGSGFVCRIILKPLFARERPFYAHGFELFTRAPISYSMPSTHTAMAIAAALVLFTVNKKLGAVALIFALMVSLSRIYLLVHYPTDVLAGIGVGIIIALCAIFATKYMSSLLEKHWPWFKEMFPVA